MGIDKFANDDVKLLYKALLTLETEEDSANLLDDLCSVAEIFEMSRRMRAAEMLYHNHQYTEIVKKTGLSTATISRVSRCLRYGSDGYQKTLDKIFADEKETEKP